MTGISEIGRKDLGPARSDPYRCDSLLDPSGMVAMAGPGGARLDRYMALHHCPGGRTGLATLRLTPVSAIISDLPASVIVHHHRDDEVIPTPPGSCTHEHQDGCGTNTGQSDWYGGDCPS